MEIKDQKIEEGQATGQNVTQENQVYYQAMPVQPYQYAQPPQQFAPLPQQMPQQMFQQVPQQVPQQMPYNQEMPYFQPNYQQDPNYQYQQQIQVAEVVIPPPNQQAGEQTQIVRCNCSTPEGRKLWLRNGIFMLVIVVTIVVTTIFI